MPSSKVFYLHKKKDADVIILIPILLLMLAIGYYLSSWLGILVATLVYISIYIGLTKMFRAGGEVEIDSTEDSIRSYVGLIFAGLVFISTPIWDSNGFCEHQRETFEVNQTRTLEDIFKGEQRTETYIRDVSEQCKEDGGWEFIGGWSNENWRVDVFFILSFLAGLIVLFTIYVFGKVGLEELSISRTNSRSAVTPKPKKITPGIGKSGREIIDSFKCKDDFDFYFKNTQDVIAREHLSKGDYDVWFFRCAQKYIDEYPKYSPRCAPADISRQLSWAKKHIETVYSGKSVETGKKRAKKIDDLQGQLELLN